MRLPQNPRKIRAVDVKSTKTAVQQTGHPNVSTGAREREESSKKGLLHANAAAASKPQKVGEGPTAMRRRVSRCRRCWRMPERATLRMGRRTRSKDEPEGRKKDAELGSQEENQWKQTQQTSAK
jgi:hypothetical protein